VKNINTGKDEWILFQHVNAYHEFALLQSILDQLNIPVLKKQPGAGQYTDTFMGSSFSGYDIYVPVSRLMEAKEILDNSKSLDTTMSIEYSLEENQQFGYILHYRERFKKLLIIFVIIPTILVAIYGLFQSLKPLFETL